MPDDNFFMIPIEAEATITKIIVSANGNIIHEGALKSNLKDGDMILLSFIYKEPKTIKKRKVKLWSEKIKHKEKKVKNLKPKRGGTR